MKTTQTDVLIIGGGLTGLTLAYYLKSSCKSNGSAGSVIMFLENNKGGSVDTICLQWYFALLVFASIPLERSLIEWILWLQAMVLLESLFAKNLKYKISVTDLKKKLIKLKVDFENMNKVSFNRDADLFNLIIKRPELFEIDKKKKLPVIKF